MLSVSFGVYGLKVGNRDPKPAMLNPDIPKTLKHWILALEFSEFYCSGRFFWGPGKVDARQPSATARQSWSW